MLVVNQKNKNLNKKKLNILQIKFNQKMLYMDINFFILKIRKSLKIKLLLLGLL